MSLPSRVWHLQGTDQDGPNVVLMGGTHGDELTGPELIRRILKPLGLSEDTPGTFDRSDIRGNLFLVFGNPVAMRQNTRGTTIDKPDLNRSFTRAELEREARVDDREDLRRARELAPLLTETDFLFDIHATSSPCEAFVCFGEDTPAHRELYRQIPIRTILTDPTAMLARDYGFTEIGTTDSIVNTRGGSAWSVARYGKKRGVGLAYETGLETDLSVVDDVLKTVVRLLLSVGVILPSFADAIGVRPDASPSQEQRVYKLSEIVLAKHVPFVYATGMNLGWQRVRKGDLIGTYGNGVQETAPVDGMLLFQRAPHKVVPSLNLFFIAEEIAHLTL